MPKKNITTADELVPDQRNANNHTEHGTLLLEKGILQNKLGRSILISNDGHIIAGNGVTQKAKELGITKVRVIKTTGDEIIAVQRTDIESGTREFFNMALSDNIIAKENIAMDASVTDAICDEFKIEDWKEELPKKKHQPEPEHEILQVIIRVKSKRDQTALYKQLKANGYDCSVHSA